MFFILSLTAFLLLVTALYVAAEFATVSVRKVKIEALAESGLPAAVRLLPHLQDANTLDHYVAACQIGITVASLVLGAIGEKNFAVYLHQPLSDWFGLQPSASTAASRIIVIFAFTALQVILGELMPKAVAIRFTEKVALLLTWPMIISLKLFAPFINLLNGSGTLILKMMGFQGTSGRHVHSPDELSLLLQMSAKGGQLEEEDKNRLERVLQFGDRTARDVMVPRTAMVSLNLDDSPEKNLQIIEKSHYTRFPVYRGSEDRILGIIHLKDVCLYMAKTYLNTEKAPQGNFLERMVRKNVVFCPSSIGVDKVLEKLRKKRAYLAILEDEYGGTDGLVTMEDLLEEILGEINDEFDDSPTRVIEIGNNAYAAAGIISLDELYDTYGIELPMPDIHTLGGLVMHLISDIPKEGQSVEFNGYRLTVASMRVRQVMTVRIERLEAPLPEEAKS